MPLAPPIPANHPLIAATAGDGAGDSAFLPEMQIALDSSAMPSSVAGDGATWRQLEDEAASDRPEDPNLAAMLGSALPSQQPASLFPTGGVVFRLYTAHSLASTSDAAVPAIPQENAAVGTAFEVAGQSAAESAGAIEDESAALDGRADSERGHSLRDAVALGQHASSEREHAPQRDGALAVLPPAVIELPAGSDTTLTAPTTPAAPNTFAAPVVPDTPAAPAPTTDDRSRASAATTQQDPQQPADPSGLHATLSSEPTASARDTRLQVKATVLAHSGHGPRAALAPHVIELPETGAQAVADPHAAQIADGDAGLAPVFEGVLSQKAVPAPQGVAPSAVPATPAKSEALSGRPGFSGKAAARDSDSRSVRSAPDSKTASRFAADSASTPDEVQEAGQRKPLMRTWTAEGHSASASTPAAAGAGFSDVRLSTEAPASQQGEATAESANADRSAESGAPAQLLLEPDADASGRVGDAVREVSLKMENPDGAAVHLKFTERRGEVHLMTRTQDAVLSEKLASDLPELRKALEDAGMSADIWAVGQEPSSRMESTPARSDSGSHSSNASGLWHRQGEQGGRKQDGQPHQWADQIEDALDGGQGVRK